VSSPGSTPQRGAVLCLENDGRHKVLFPGNKTSFHPASSMRLLWQRPDAAAMPGFTDSLAQNGVQRFRACLSHVLEARFFPSSNFAAPALVPCSWDSDVVRLICDMLQSFGDGALEIPDEELLLNHIQMLRVTMIHDATSRKEIDGETLKSLRVVEAAYRDYDRKKHGSGCQKTPF